MSGIKDKLAQKALFPLLAVYLAAPWVAWAATDAGPTVPDDLSLGGIMQVLATALMTVLLAAAGFATRWLIRWSGSRLAQIALERVNWAATVAVTEVHQTYVEAIKEANADGKLTKEEQAEALRRALQTLKDLLGPGGIKLVGRAFGAREGGLDSFLKSCLEAALADFKRKIGLAKGWDYIRGLFGASQPSGA